jgi:integrase
MSDQSLKPKSGKNAVENDLAEILAPGREYKSLAGYTFVVDSSRWELSKGVVIQVGFTLEKLHPRLASGFIATLANIARTASSRHTFNYLERFRHMLKTVGCDVTTTTLINYRSTLNRSTEYYLGTLRSFFYKWHDLGYPGIGPDVVDLLKSWTLRGNLKGDAVQRLDPEEGPLTDNELIAFNEGAARAFEKGQIAISDLSLALLMSSSGRRPLQIAYLKIGDIDGSRRNAKGEKVLQIYIPRAKQRGEIFRGSFKTFRVTRELWNVLSAQKNECIGYVEKVLGYELQDGDRQLLPLFPDLEAFRGVSSITELRSLLDSDRLHITPREINGVLAKIVEASQCFSERTGELLKVPSRRFRYTLGTRAAREGLGVMIIAEMLDHTDTQSADVYIKNIPEHVIALDAAVGHQLAPYAQAFQGVMVDREEEARRGDDPSSRIRHGRQGAATCGKYGPCGANVPIPCYTCLHFQPWVDGPHEAVYTDLIAERERIFEVTGDLAMAAVNDRAILAVAEVVRRCKQRRDELAKDSVP